MVYWLNSDQEQDMDTSLDNQFKRQSMVWKEKDKAAPKRLSCGIRWKGNGNSLFEFQGSIADPHNLPHRTTITATL